MATILGDAYGNNYSGTNDADEIFGGGGDDTLANGQGIDTLYGDADNDRLTLGVGGSRGYGGDGNDIVVAGSGDIWLWR